MSSMTIDTRLMQLNILANQELAVMRQISGILRNGFDKLNIVLSNGFATLVASQRYPEQFKQTLGGEFKKKNITSETLGKFTDSLKESLQMDIGFDQMVQGVRNVGDVLEDIADIPGMGLATLKKKKETEESSPFEIPSILEMFKQGAQRTQESEFKYKFGDIGDTIGGRIQDFFTKRQSYFEGYHIGTPTIGKGLGDKGFQLGGLLDKVITPIGKGIRGVGSITKGTLKGMSALGKSMKSAGIQGMIMQSVTDWFTSFMQSFLAPLQILSPLFSAFGTALSLIFVPTMTQITEILIPFLPMMIDIGTSFGELYSSTTLLISPLGWLLSAMSAFAQSPLFEIVTNFITETMSKVSGFGEFLGGLWTNITGAFSNGLTWVWNAATDFFKRLAEWLQGLKEDASNLDVDDQWYFSDTWSNVSWDQESY